MPRERWDRMHNVCASSAWTTVQCIPRSVPIDCPTVQARGLLLPTPMRELENENLRPNTCHAKIAKGTSRRPLMIHACLTHMSTLGVVMAFSWQCLDMTKGRTPSLAVERTNSAWTIRGIGASPHGEDDSWLTPMPSPTERHLGTRTNACDRLLL